MFGSILTNAPTFESYYKHIRSNRYDITKIVTGWGLNTGWNDTTRARLLAATNATIVRTVSGDPSYDNGNRDYRYPDSKRAIIELEPWLYVKPHCFVEIGNEPNIGDVDPYIYRYALLDTLQTLQKRFPYAQFISSALVQNANMDNWYTILRDVLVQFNYVGVHLYDHTSFHEGNAFTKRIIDQITRARNIGKLLFVTECGINVVNPRRIEEYKSLLRIEDIVGVTYYHYNAKKDIDPQYHIG